MKSANCKSIPGIIVILSALLSWSGAVASDVDDLTAILQEFLEATHTKAAHEVFWADDLIYTSSNGTRFGKSEILAGFADEDPSEEVPAIIYSAQDIDVRVFDTAAVAAFRLVAVPSGDSGDVLEYFNTGTFLRREGSWRVVAWQATAIPSAAEVAD